MHVSVSRPEGLALVSLMRLDRNGRAVWTAAQLGEPWLGHKYDDTCALGGVVEYVATYSDGSREAGTAALDTPERPRLVRLAWSAAGTLTAAGSVWTAHDAILDAAYDMAEVSTVSRRGTEGVHAVRNRDRTDAGRLVVWCTSHSSAVHLQADLERHPLQWLRVPDQDGMDHVVIVGTLGLRTEGGAWMVDVGYTTRRDLLVVPHGHPDGHAERTLEDHGGTLADLAEAHDMLAELR